MDPSIFKEDQCEILMGTNLDDRAFKTAVSFVPSMRMKTWKPGKNAGDNTIGTFCYMDTMENGGFPSNQSCTDGTLFGYTVPFIKRSFVDNKLDNTDTFPTEKCVFEIDDSQVTDANLNPFWKKINDLDCIGQFAEYQKSNALLKNENAQLQIQIENKKIENKNLRNDILDLEDTLTAKGIIYQKVTIDIGTETNSNEELLRYQDLLNKEIQDQNSNFLKMYEKYIQDSNIYNTFYYNLSNLIGTQTITQSNLKADITKLEGEITKESQKYGKTYVSYSNMQKQYFIKYDENKKLEADLAVTIGDYQACTKNLISIKEQLEKKVIEYNNLSNIYSSNFYDYSICMPILSNCTFINLPTCLNTQSNLTIDYNKIALKYQKTINPLDECMTKHTNLIAQSNALSNAIGQWLATHYICGDHKTQLDTIKLQSDMLSKTCRVSELTTYDTKLLDTNALDTQGTIDQATACVSNRNTLYTSVPQQPTLTNPNASKVFSEVQPPPPTDKRPVQYHKVVKDIFVYTQPVHVYGGFKVWPWNNWSGDDWPDTGAQWIWANVSFGVKGVWASFQKIFESTEEFEARMFYKFDNYGEIWFNNDVYKGGKIKIIEGINVVETYLLNYEGPVAFMLTIVDNSGKVIVHTDNTWKWYWSTSLQAMGRHR